jgi:hypothetical protein
MALEELLGNTGLNLIDFPPKGLSAHLPAYPFYEQEMLVANIAEYAISLGAQPGRDTPYEIDRAMIVYIAHKSNTLTYTCATHAAPAQPLPLSSEYAFLFTSDCWKLREILFQEPLGMLRQAPAVVWERMLESGWHFLPQVTVSHSAAKETLFLWCAKSILLTDQSLDELTFMTKLRTLSSQLGLSQRALSQPLMSR